MSNDSSILKNKTKAENSRWGRWESLLISSSQDWTGVQWKAWEGLSSMERWLFCVQAEGLGNGPLNQSKCSYFYLLASARFFSASISLRIISDWSFSVIHFYFTTKSLFPYSILFKINNRTQLWQTLLSIRIHFCFYVDYRLLIICLFKNVLSQISLQFVL